MRSPRLFLLLIRHTLAAGGLVLLCAGCVSPWWNGFLDPSQVGNFHDNVVNEIQQTISFRDTPPGIVGAVDPTPDDLIQTVKEYEIGVGDMLSIRMLDFVAPDIESEFQPTVDELGYIDLPQLGYILVEGMTKRMLSAEIIHRAQTLGIFRRQPEPTVVVTYLSQQQRSYHISGAIQAAGRYPIRPPDFRLHEAINQAGGLDPSVKMIYLIRNEPKPKRVIEHGVHPSGPIQPPDNDSPEPPVTPMTLSGEAGGPNPPARPAEPAPVETQPPAGEKPPASSPAQKPKTRESSPTPSANPEQELIEAISPGVSSRPAERTEPPTQPGGSAPPVEEKTSPSTLPPFIFVNDKFIESPSPTTQERLARPPGPVSPQPTTEPGEAQKPVDWQELGMEGQQRIIRIPAEKLANGDYNFNIVIKHDDWIKLDAGRVGVFYLGGHVVRPGVYSLTGQEITLKQAILAAGGLDALAWPTRCEIVRRIDGEREEFTQWDLARIMAGQDPDLFLKPEDVINVGTHAIAPLLATIRNSFRLTYGFGFVYDRNFGDIDSFSPKSNPEERRRQTLNQRFPGLFP